LCKKGRRWLWRGILKSYKISSRLIGWFKYKYAVGGNWDASSVYGKLDDRGGIWIMEQGQENLPVLVYM